MPYSRRRMLRGSAVALTGAAAGALTVSRTAETATATTDLDLSITGDEIEVREGNFAAVWLDATLEWAYEVPAEESPGVLDLVLLAGTDADDMTTVASTAAEPLFLEASGDESFEVDLLETGVLEADALVPSEGGTTTATTVHVGAEMQLHDDAGLVIAADSQTDTATIDVEKSDYDPDEYGAVGGTGELTIALE